jgi:maltose alpha-D-glucosyltransferase/alpha-amylase
LQESDLWWKNAVVYCLDPETYLDTNGDGIGDLGGLIERVDYLAGMGVTCLWLMPFYPSPNRDDGYDITDFYDVDERLGTLGDFVVLVRAAKNLGLRVIIDLVVNHTSDRHPWFRAARASRNSPYRDYYVWRDEPAAEPDTGVVFPDAEDSLWAWDERAGQWYLHHFYTHQPDLNIANPRVREEIAKIAGFWLQLGVDGFRVDAVPFLFEFGGVENAGDLDPHVLLKELRSFISRRRGDAILLGEVNLPPKQLARYFGDQPGDEIQLLFNFPVMQRLYLALSRGEARPLAKALGTLPVPPREGQWAMFVRNHDELTLDQLSDAEREEVFAAFGPGEDMQLFGRGLRRRLPPMLDGDQQRMRLVYSLLFSLPGTPVLFYGEEIGMGENLAIPGRLAVRAPMQWSDGPTAGFSTGRPSRLLRPVTPGRFGPMAVNVADQRRDPSSLLNWMERVIRRRREIPEIGWGRIQLLETGHDAVLAHGAQWRGRTFIGVHNLAAAPAAVRLDLSPVGEPAEATVDDLLDEAPPTLQIDSSGRLELKLEGFGYRWLRLRTTAQQPTP